MLALVPGPSSVVIEDFHFMEFPPSPLSAAVIRVTFVPAPPASAVSCTMLRPIGGLPYQLFTELYGDYELALGGDGRVLAGEKVTVNVTVRLDDSTATVLTAIGPIVSRSPPSSVPSYVWDSATDMVCR